jgi:hypothetical protein
MSGAPGAEGASKRRHRPRVGRGRSAHPERGALDGVAHLGERAPHAHAHGAGLHPEALRDLVERQPVREAQQHHGALALAEHGQPLADVGAAGHQVAHQHLLGVGHQGLAHVVLAPERPRLARAAPQVIEAAVPRDGEQPGARRGIPAKFGQREEGLAERVLRQVLGRAAVAHDGGAEVQHVPPVCAHQPVGGGVQVTALEVPLEALRAGLGHECQGSRRRSPTLCHRLFFVHPESVVIPGE